MARHARKQSDIGFAAISVVGGLINPDKIAKIASVSPDTKTAVSYSCPKGTSLRDEIARYFRIGQAEWQTFSRIENPSFEQCTAFAKTLLEEVFGFSSLQDPKTRRSDGHSFKIALEGKNGRVPVVVAPPATGDDLDSFKVAYTAFGDAEGGRTKRRPDALLQEWLNASDPTLWGLVFAGDRVRLMRDNASFTRPAFIEADLGAIFRDEMFADFTALWLLIHATRFGNEAAAVTDCSLERWREEGVESGTAARDRLRENVEEALLSLGQGFLEGNPDLRDKLDSGTLSDQKWFEQLLRVVYRLIFVAVTEERDLLHDPQAKTAAKTLYDEGYSFAQMRERSTRRTLRDPHGDVWDGTRVLFRALDKGQAKLGLPALGGIFDESLTPDLSEARIANKHFLNVIYRLSFIHDEKTRVRINWRDMATEELGSVYEGLLELVPMRSNQGRDFSFAEEHEARGNARKMSGSYYTPDALVQALLDNALNPLLEKAEANGGVDALLELKVIDPACGSAHFLLGAARRMAERVANLRDSENPDFQHALRDVVRRCIYGVDRNPMAVELAKVALWIEAVEPGKPLSFLDSHIRCGDSLAGVFDLSALRDGIPDDAYKVLDGDDREVVNYYKTKNRREISEREKVEGGFGLAQQNDLASELATLAAMPEEDVKQIAAKRDKFKELTRPGAGGWVLERACDLWTSVFFAHKRKGGPFSGPDGLPRRGSETVATSGMIWELLRGREPFDALTEEVVKLSNDYRFFHWPLAFADIMARGGFDVVLGNPPWETMSPDSKEFFAKYDPSVRAMSPTEQKRSFEKLLEQGDIASKWKEYCHDLYASVHFMKSSGRYRMFAPGNLGKGDFNVYRMFVETALAATKSGGVASQFVPEGLYNGANATAIREELFKNFRLARLGGFENTKEIWFKKVHSAAKFALYVAWRGGGTDHFAAAFRINTIERLQEFVSGHSLSIPVSVVAEFSPDAKAVMEFAAQSEVDICSKMYRLYPKFGEEIDGQPYRHYMAEAHMGNNRDLFSEGDEGLPIFEGRMIDTYDYRAKGYVSGRGREAVWEDLDFDASNKQIQPQWRILSHKLPDKLKGRIDRYRIGFCDVASPTNSRSLVAALLPSSSVSGHKVPTIEFLGGSPKDILLWLGVANSFAMDFLVRKKVALTMSYTIMDSLPFPRDFDCTPSAAEIARRVCMLCAVGPEMEEFRRKAVEAGILSYVEDVVEEPGQRWSLAAEIDALVARDVFGLTMDEMLYILDPSNILGEECDTETFKALRNKELREHGEFRTQQLIVEAWKRLPNGSGKERAGAA